MKKFKKNEPKKQDNPILQEKLLSVDELDQVTGGFSLRNDSNPVDTTDIHDDTLNKI